MREDVLGCVTHSPCGSPIRARGVQDRRSPRGTPCSRGRRRSPRADSGVPRRRIGGMSPIPRRMPPDRRSCTIIERIADVFEINSIVLHKDAASAKIRCCRYGLRPASVKTSTLRPSNSWRSCSSAVTSRSVRPGSTSTSRSTSLSERSSPRATEPNTRMLRAP